MTTALYRRYRPDTFQDVIGQDHVTAPLMAALRADRVTHAYLFSGPRGCGKTTSARILARCLNCVQAPTDSPCGECPSCRDLATGGPGSLDVVEIDAASHNGVDDARDLRERAAFAPARDRYKIFILDEAHMVTAQGFNALLKLVEEPPAHVKFIFATTEPEKVIGTIRSRTHHYPFRLVPPDVLEGYLGHLCDSEGVSVGPGVFPLVVRAGGGSVRDTLSVMDQLIGGALDGGVDYQRAVALLGYTDTTMLDQCVDAIAAADGSGVFRVVDRVVTSGHDPRRFVEDLLQRLRDLLVIALAGSEAGPALGSLPADELARMEVQARTMGAAALSRAADMTAQALGSMVGATSPRLQLELLMARLLVPAVPAAQAPAAQGAPGGPGGSGVQDAAVAAPLAPAAQGRPPAAQAVPAAPGAATPSAVPGAHPGASGAPGASASARPAAGPASSSGEQAAAPTSPAGRNVSGPASSAPAARRGSQEGQPGAPARGRAQAPGRQAPSGDAPGGAAEAEMIRTRWDEVLEAAKRSRRATWALVGPNSQPGTLQAGVFTLLFTAPGLVGAFENGGHGPIFSAAIHQALGLRVEVHAVLVGDDGPGGGPAGPGGPGGPGGSGPVPGLGETGGSTTGGTADTGRPRAGAGGPGGWDRAGGPGGWVGPDGPGGPGGDSGPGDPRLVTQQPVSPSTEDSSKGPEEGDRARSAVAAGQGAPASQGSGPTTLQPPAAEGLAQDVPVLKPPPLEAPAPDDRDDDGGGARGRGAAPPAPDGRDDDGWGPVAVPGGGLEQGRSATPPPGTRPWSPGPADDGPTWGRHRGAASLASSEPAASESPASPASPAFSASWTGVTASPSASSSASSSASPSPSESLPASPSASSSASPDPAQDASLAPVRRLRPLPDVPTTPQGLAPVTWDGSAETFSDGVPLPEEPGDPDGPGAEGLDDAHRPGAADPGADGTWVPTGVAGSRLAAAMAAARAAAQEPDDGSSLADDAPSEDDEDAEDAGVVGLEVVKRILGATVIEEVTVTQEGY